VAVRGDERQAFDPCVQLARHRALGRVRGKAAVGRERPWSGGRHSLFLLVTIMRRTHPYTQNPPKTYAAISGWQMKTPFELHAANAHRAPHGGEVGVTAFRSLSGRGTVFGDKICKMVPCGPEGEQDHAGVLAPVGILLSPAVGAVLMSFSTIIVALNAQVLRGLDLRPSQT
jgi:hypothetical protein